MQALWMLAASVLFAAMGVCVKLAGDSFSAGELVFYRGFVAVVLLGAWLAVRRLPLATPYWRAHLRRGLAGFVSLVAYFSAIGLIPLATAVTLNYTSPLFLALMLALWLREPVRPLLLGALALGFVGIVLVLQPTLTDEQWAGGLLGLTSGMVAAVAYLNVRELGRLGEPEWRTVFFFSLVSALGGLPWFLLSDPLHAAGMRDWLLVLGVGAFGTAAQLCMTAAYKRGATLAVAGIAYTTVAFSSVFALLLWQESLPRLAWLGVALIVVSGIAASAQVRPAGGG